MICKDCIHYNVCQYHIDEETNMTVNECPDFKDKDLYVKLPVPLGTVVYRLYWDYTDDEYISKRVWFIDPVRFAIWHLDGWNIDVFATEEEALEQLEKERRNESST